MTFSLRWSFASLLFRTPRFSCGPRGTERRRTRQRTSTTTLAKEKQNNAAADDGWVGAP